MKICEYCKKPISIKKEYPNRRFHKKCYPLYRKFVYIKEWAYNNRDKIAEYKRRWRNKYPEKNKEIKRRWDQNNRLKYREMQRRWRNNNKKYANMCTRRYYWKEKLGRALEHDAPEWYVEHCFGQLEKNNLTKNQFERFNRR